MENVSAEVGAGAGYVIHPLTRSSLPWCTDERKHIHMQTEYGRESQHPTSYTSWWNDNQYTSLDNFTVLGFNPMERLGIRICIRAPFSIVSILRFQLRSNDRLWTRFLPRLHQAPHQSRSVRHSVPIVSTGRRAARLVTLQSWPLGS
jgi:hypothetical protein